MGDDVDELRGSQLLDLMPGKREVTLLLLEKGTVYVHLDARRPGVELPLWLKSDGHVVLQFGTSATFPIRDFRLDDDRISATLFFQGVPHQCVVPWGSVFAIVSADNRGMAWPDDVPGDISARAPNGPRASGDPRSASKGGGPARSNSMSPRLAGHSPKLESVPSGRSSSAQSQTSSLRGQTPSLRNQAPSDRTDQANAGPSSQPKAGPSSQPKAGPSSQPKAGPSSARPGPSLRLQEAPRPSGAGRADGDAHPTGTVRRDGKPSDPEIVRDVAPAKVEAQGGHREGNGSRTKRPLPPYLRVVK